MRPVKTVNDDNTVDVRAASASYQMALWSAIAGGVFSAIVLGLLIFNYVQINSIWGIIVFTMFLMEVPTGILADRWGRHRAIQLAILMQFIGEVLFLFITDYWLLVIDAVIAGTGFAFASGALEAMVYDQLKAEDRPEDMQAVMGKITGAGYIGFVLSFGLSGLLVPRAEQENIATAILATAIAVGLGFLVTLWLKPEKNPAEDLISRASPEKMLKDGIHLLRENTALQHLLLLSVFSIAFWDYLINLYQPYFHIDVNVIDGDKSTKGFKNIFNLEKNVSIGHKKKKRSGK